MRHTSRKNTYFLISFAFIFSCCDAYVGVDGYLLVLKYALLMQYAPQGKICTAHQVVNTINKLLIFYHLCFVQIGHGFFMAQTGAGHILTFCKAGTYYPTWFILMALK